MTAPDYAVPPPAGMTRLAGAGHPLRLDRPVARVAFLLALLPVLSGLMFRTYSYHCAPGWYEALRQIDFLFLMSEVGAVLYARSQGLNIAALMRRLPRDVQIAGVVLIATFWLGSVFMSEWPARSILRITFWPIHILFAIAVWHLASAAKAGVGVRDIRSLTLWLGAGLLLYIPILVIHMISAADLAQQTGTKIIWTSAIPGFLSVRIFGFHTGAVATLSIGLLWQRGKVKRSDSALYATLFLAAALLFWSGSRGSIYAAGIGLVVSAIILRRAPRAKVLLAMLATLLLAVCASSIWLPGSSSFGIFRVVLDEQASSPSGFTAGRTEMWAQTWAAFLQSPLIGHGEDSTMWLVRIDNIAHTQPHNLFLQLLGNWGIFAAICAFWLLGRVGLLAIASVRRTPHLFPVLAMLAMLVVTSMVDGVIYHPRSVMLFMAGIGIILASSGQTVRADHR